MRRKGTRVSSASTRPGYASPNYRLVIDCERTDLVDVQDYVRILRTRWHVIVASAAVAILVVLGASMMHTPTYETSTRLFVYPQSRVASYAQMLNGGVLVERTLDRLDLAMSKPELAAKIASSVIPGTMLVRVTVTDDDPDRAQEIANTLSEEFIALAQELEATESGDSWPPVGTRDGVGTSAEAQTALQVAAPNGSTALIEPTPRVTLETPATTPTEVPTDRQANLTLAALVGLLLGVALAVLRDLMDKTVRDSKTAESLVGAELVGTIPFDRGRVGVIAFSASNTDSVITQEYRKLSANLQYRRSLSPSVVVITSPVSGDGKAATAVNTALALAESGQDVCLVEADLRAPRLAETLGVREGGGLSDVLVGKSTLDEVLRETEYRGLTLLPAGDPPSNPSELIASSATRESLERLRLRYDFVIVAAPSVLPVADATVLGALSDGTLLVARQGGTSKGQLALAAESLNRVGANILGVVLTMTSETVDIEKKSKDYATSTSA
ncbi:MAG: polysaccharide biosynthesis tyrosine autokinase [Hyphomicrobiales bacterium]|nr:MAG: polysaccharide biosynthesis tyrosine autokinase [Hyphomicrobiales bacterium]